MGCSDGGVRFRTDLKCMIINSCAGDFIQAEMGPLRYSCGVLYGSRLDAVDFMMTVCMALNLG